LLSAGAVGEAAALLTEPYRIRGRVVSGERRGRNLGFPTANLDDVDTLIPGDGIYAGRFVWPGGERAAAIHIGPNVTFGENVRKIECHLLDFSGDLYGAPAEVTFLARLRDVQPFPSAERLIEALHADVARTREIVTLTGADAQPRSTH
jgi:riboflavin kinase/FMN adenylyltransferase